MTMPTQVAQKLVSLDPATGEVLAELECAGAVQVREAVERARSAQTEWANSPIRQRAALLRKFQDVLQAQKREVAQLITREAGKPYVEALLTEVIVALDAARFCMSEVFRFLRPEAVPHANLLMKTKQGHLLREPHGVIGIIAPWNYPFSIPAAESFAALATGNAVVLKPSEFTPLVALKLQSLLEEAGLPKGVLQVVVGDGATGAALVDAGVDKLIFTGSVTTGKRVAAAAAERLLPVVLELGGKDPMLVLQDADLEVASSAAVWAAFVNAGQTCLSVERCYVQERLYGQFLEACVTKAKKLKVGNGLEAGTDVGPMIHPRQLQVVEEHVSEAVRRGARLLAGGHRLPQIGENFYEPTILADVTHQMRIMREETFGPVLPVASFKDEAEAVQLANDSEFGLAASIWTRDRRRGEALARKIKAGTVMVNDAIACFGISEAPHGGVKSSGLGRTHGRQGLEEMVRIKYVDSDLMPSLPKVWWYGYGADFSRQIEGFTDFLFARSWAKRLAGGLRSLGAFSRKGRI
jgi:acyl-CoA reductase-like NAD-dependent aldehyde dehydrogenase